MTSKSELRRRLRARRQTIQPGSVIHNAVELLRAYDVQKVALYAALNDEVSVVDVMSAYPQAQYFFPKVHGAHDLKFIHVKDPADLVPGAFGIKEPVGGVEEPLRQMSAVLVPGLAFDRFGARLGRGRGYYDRALSSVTALKIGICSKDQVIDRIPTEPFDIGMDFVATDYFILRPLRAPTKGLH
jgi:5-formyltetrahydrofolate cyclo-ligase